MIIEETIINYLAEETSVPVFAEYPENQTGRFIVVDMIGSSYSNHIQTATIAIQSYGTSKLDAARLNEDVKCALSQLKTLNAKISSDYYFADTRAKRYRYQAVYEINTLRGIEI